ncbi:biotin--[acetyl-CoA-carboxylase] ligase [Candidatus Williamhamiltonella defendens]|uniref:Bifunctional ligase/repressor BirA n=2 Tax=Candidatus Williamhamiltonella defendens TaxID=138072 RepID=A0A2D3T2V9_9ENTR|nr:bifunctional biotin--[acetyl-CoA-carboxylase] ligase/biotin operon repressor BirA [Candidatus Hamiltonella defensa]ACQ68210.1 bifunctional: biotin-[acetylCoA carboxylase] holoenzyme synthetase; transcriptional repressor of biotin synthesis (BirA family) [Candidatus Hamiltonella defensa 5AT (Acyrthosiphon pisum)]ASV34069.1 bifunctional biotin--[acetyl-CoA-carboxylase] ligase/biotin operon repressor BirA [Candidatus Hamiltonella defensa]ATW22791.1 biotin--[acetyl-CoA-carboxylase] ligase [Candid
MKNFIVPFRLIRLLSTGAAYSGEQLGQYLEISLSAVNQHIQTLRHWGLEIEAQTIKGYYLSSPIELLDEKKILRDLPEGRIKVLALVDSTNQYLLDNIETLRSGDACVAEHQTAGRGRRGREWVSPFGQNLYLSMFWRLEKGTAAAVGLSLVIGIVITQVLRNLGGIDIRVKWPNDLYYRDKKLAGVLVELLGKKFKPAQVIIGMGININNPSSNKGIEQNWSHLKEAGITIDRNKLTALLLSELRSQLIEFEKTGLSTFISKWHELDNYLNRPVKLIVGDQQIQGIARGIDQHGGLLLETEGGIKTYQVGDISLRGR